MLAQKPWLRITLFVVVAAIILVVVGGLAYGLGTRNAIGVNPRAALQDRADYNGPGQGGRPGRDGQAPSGPGANNNPGANTGPGANSGNLPQTFTRSTIVSSNWYSSPLLWLLRGLISLAFLAMLVLGTVAFFRTNRMQAAGGAVVVDSPEKTAKKKSK